jgi:hypothetical protein
VRAPEPGEIPAPARIDARRRAVRRCDHERLHRRQLEAAEGIEEGPGSVHDLGAGHGPKKQWCVRKDGSRYEQVPHPDPALTRGNDIRAPGAVARPLAPTTRPSR